MILISIQEQEILLSKWDQTPDNTNQHLSLKQLDNGNSQNYSKNSNMYLAFKVDETAGATYYTITQKKNRFGTGPF